jgi:hypothetical protein
MCSLRVVYCPLASARVALDARAVAEDLDGGLGGPQVEALADQAEVDAVEVAVEADVVVEGHPLPGPHREVVRATSFRNCGYPTRRRFELPPPGSANAST